MKYLRLNKKTGKKEIITVFSGLGGDSYMAGVEKKSHSGISHSRICSKYLPVRKSRADAESDLMAYAKKKGWEYAK